MVDRIVPATVAADRAEVTRRLGVEDHGTVVAEPFSQWVVEDDFPGGRPAWERAGVTLTDDVTPYEVMKLRLLNASHSTLAYLGALAGCTYIAEAVGHDELRQLVHRTMRQEVTPILDVPAGFDLTSYVDTLLERFANPALRHRATQVAMDGSQKLPQRTLPTARDLLARGAAPRLTCLGLAGWIRYVTARQTDAGEPLPVDDPLADTIATVTAGATTPAQVCDGMLSLGEVFDPALASDETFRHLLVEQLTLLTRAGALGAARAAVGAG
jgi:fructuronate reductase